MAVDLNRMRRAFFSAAAWCGWTEVDQADIGAEIKAAVESGNEEALAYWSWRLEQLAGWARLAERCRAVEGRVRAEFAAARKRAA